MYYSRNISIQIKRATSTLYWSSLRDGHPQNCEQNLAEIAHFRNFHTAQEQCDGRNIIILFEEGMKAMLNKAMISRKFSEDAVALSKAACIVRKDMFNHENVIFSGQFTEECQEKSIPASLKSLYQRY